MAAVAAVCAAAMQGGGRLLVAALPELEPRVNAWLASRDVTVHGLWGSWRHLNPVVGAASLVLPGAEVHDVALEIDVVESLWRNRIVARRFAVGDARLRLEQGPGGWRLEGAADGPAPDLGAFFRHSDEVRVHARVEFLANGSSGAVDLALAALNEAPAHRWQAELSTDPACGDCYARLDADVRQTGPGIGDQAGAVRFQARQFRVPAALAEALGVPAMVLEATGQWTGDGTDAAGRTDWHVSEMTLPGGPASLTVHATAAGAHGLYRGAGSLRAATPDTEVSAEDIGFAADAAGALTLWADLLDLGAWNALLVSAFGAGGTLGRWFHGVGARGELRDVRLHVDREGIAYEGLLYGANTESFNGIPRLEDARGRLRGHLHALRIALAGAPLRAAMPEHFDGRWHYDTAAGEVTLWFDTGYLGLRATGDLRSEEAAVELALALTRPHDPLEGHLSMLARVDRTTVGHARQFLPRELRGELRSWLDAGLVGGRLAGAALAYHGHTRTLPDLPMRRIALTGEVREGAVAYHPDWPIAEALSGRVTVSGTAVTGRFDAGMSLGLPVQGLQVDVPGDAAYVDVRVQARPSAGEALAFAFATPIEDLVPFACECWTGAGPVGIDATLRIPFGGPPEPGDVAVAFDLDGVSLGLTDLRLQFHDLEGSARFRSPHHLAAAGLEGTLFGFPVRIDAASDDAAVSFTLEGHSRVDDVFAVLDIGDVSAAIGGAPVARGAFDFDATFDFFAAAHRPPVLRVSTDALGLTLDLPAPLGKDPATSRTLTTRMVFSGDTVFADGDDEVASWWLRIGPDPELRGAVGIGVPPPPAEAVPEGVSIAGTLHHFDASGASTLSDVPVRWRLEGLNVNKIGLHDLELTNARLEGSGGPGELALQFDSEEMTGSLAVQPDRPLRLDLAEVRLPGGETGVDPVDVSVIPLLPAADVEIRRVLLDGDHFGSWRFGTRPAEDAVHFTNVSGDIKGLRIDALEDIVWTRDNESHFRGTVTASNLASVLPAWGYATSVESTDVDIRGDVTWPGSPLNFQLDHLSGDIGLTVTEGRFLDVADVPAGRILTLLDFSKVAQRLRLDFSDVFGQGIGFERIRASTSLDRGVLRFEEPLEIRGPSSEFRIYGTVDFHDGALDNEMVVTLPLSSSLPWYAFWLASTNPATAAGVLLGREVFKRQIEALSSARYRVTGTLEEPKPSFVGIFTGEFTEAPQASEAPPAPQQDPQE
ncbi:MAG: DUF3971 domain-containing protein [Gammaproteobacteria bacterium]|nr:DUF3971 domain-containing protein [Gammaproteobacteria bacterium]